MSKFYRISDTGIRHIPIVNIDAGTLLQIAQQKSQNHEKILKKKFISDLPTLIFSRYETGTTGIFFRPKYLFNNNKPIGLYTMLLQFVSKLN
jgi:hypothetical protein